MRMEMGYRIWKKILVVEESLFQCVYPLLVYTIKKERQHVNSIRTCVCMVRSTTFFFAKSGTSTFALTLTTATCTQPATDEFCMRLVRK